jgi:hypothetical protein
MVSIDRFDKGSQAPHVHPAPAGQSIYPIDKSQPGANRISGEYDRFHLAKAKRDFIEIDRDGVGFSRVHSVAATKEQSLPRTPLRYLVIALPYGLSKHPPRLLLERNDSFMLCPHAARPSDASSMQNSCRPR